MLVGKGKGTLVDNPRLRGPPGTRENPDVWHINFHFLIAQPYNPKGENHATCIFPSNLSPEFQAKSPTTATARSKQRRCIWPTESGGLSNSSTHGCTDDDDAAATKPSKLTIAYDSDILKLDLGIQQSGVDGLTTRCIDLQPLSRI